MSIPLDRLYHFIEDIAQRIFKDRVIIYHFYPHGSKNVENMQSLNKEKWQDAQLSPNLYCVDQEPLDYDYYKDGHYGKHTLQSLLDITPHFLKKVKDAGLDTTEPDYINNFFLTELVQTRRMLEHINLK